VLDLGGIEKVLEAITKKEREMEGKTTVSLIILSSVLLLLSSLGSTSAQSGGKILYHEHADGRIFTQSILLDQGRYTLSARTLVGTYIIEAIDIHNLNSKTIWTDDSATQPRSVILAGSRLGTRFAALTGNANNFTNPQGQLSVYDVQGKNGSAPLWSVNYPGTLYPYQVSISRNGQIIVAVFYGKTLNNTVFWYNANNGQKIGEWTGASGVYASETFLSDDGKLIGLEAGWGLWVLEPSATGAAVLLNYSTGWSNQCFCMSPSGTQVYFASEKGYLFTLSGNKKGYDLTWESDPPVAGLTGGTCAVSEDNVAVAWTDANTYNQVVYGLYSTKKNGGSAPVWEHKGKPDVGGGQDSPSSATFSHDGKMAAFTTWGDFQKNNPQWLVFNVNSANPVWSYTTPGSMLSTDIAYSAEMKGYIAVASGKDVHANSSGNSGDLFIALIQ